MLDEVNLCMFFACELCSVFMLKWPLPILGKVAELPTLSEQLAWCVVTQKPKDDMISKLQQRAEETIAGLKKKVGKGATGTGYIGSKVSPNFIEVSTLRRKNFMCIGVHTVSSKKPASENISLPCLQFLII